MGKIKLAFLFALVLALCTGAFAGTDCGKGNGGQNQGKGDPTCKTKGTGNGSQGGNGGNGGNGGSATGGSSTSVNTNTNTSTSTSTATGGTGIGIGGTAIAKGGSVKDSGNSSSSSSATGGSVRDSGNSQNTNVNVAEGGQGGSARQGQQQGQLQGQSQSSTSLANNGGQSNTQVTEYNQVHQAPTVFAPEAYPTAPCRAGISGGGSGLLGGGALGFSRVDKDCSAMELARAFHSMGAERAAIETLCSTKAAERAKPTICKDIRKQ